MISGILGLVVVFAIGGGILATVIQRGDEPVDRGATVRRVYLYLVSLISYIAALFGLDGVLRTLADVWLGNQGGLYTINSAGYLREQLARTAGILVIATVVFLLHWAFIQRRRTQPGEATAALRKLFFYVALGFTIGFALVNSYTLITGIADLAFGLPLDQSGIWPNEWLHLAAIILASLTLMVYLRTVLQADGDYGAETNRAARLWRKLYLLVACLAGLTLILWGTTNLLNALLQSLFDQLSSVLSLTGGLPQSWSSSIAQILLGALLLRAHWREWQSITQSSPAELASSVRRLYLYAAVIISAAFALMGSASLLNAILLRIFGNNNDSWFDLLQQNRLSVAAIAPGIIAWRWYWRQLHSESKLFGESQEADTIRRIYYYAVAAAGLALLWVGAGALVQVILDWLFRGDLLGRGRWGGTLGSGLGLLEVGETIWSLQWQEVQPIARQADETGAIERGSLPRRIYLYGVALIGALVILYFVAQVLYRLFLMLLGEPNAAFFSAQTADEVARSLIAAAIWGVHMLALRTDITMGGQAPTAQRADQRRQIESRIMRLEQELAAAKEELQKFD